MAIYHSRKIAFLKVVFGSMDIARAVPISLPGEIVMDQKLKCTYKIKMYVCTMYVHVPHSCTCIPSNFFNSYNITCTAVSREEDKLKQVCTKVPSRMMVAYL